LFETFSKLQQVGISVDKEFVNPSMKKPEEDVLWEQVFEVLGSDDRLKRFLRVPRHEIVAMMKVHGTDLSQKIFILFRLIEKGYRAEATRLVMRWGDYKAFAMILHMVRSVRIWKLEVLGCEGKKVPEL
jgi:hypothetical protein